MSLYRDLKVWQQSFKLVQEVYGITNQLPENEKFGLTSQIRRSAISIPSNIAEGQQRSGQNEFSHFISIARGSAAELSTQLLLAKEIYSIKVDETVKRLEGVQKMLYVLQTKL